MRRGIDGLAAIVQQNYGLKLLRLWLHFIVYGFGYSITKIKRSTNGKRTPPKENRTLNGCNCIKITVLRHKPCKLRKYVVCKVFILSDLLLNEIYNCCEIYKNLFYSQLTTNH